MSGFRYVIRRMRYVDALGEEVHDQSVPLVFEPVAESEPTGLLDARGNELYRVREREPVGFLTKKD